MREKIIYNRRAQSLVFSGANYQYMPLNEANVDKYGKFMECFPKKDRIEFVDLNKIKFESIRQVKILFAALDSHFKQLHFLTIQ
jgi:hypothetical protein